MKALRRILFALFVCLPVLISCVGCQKVYVEEEVKSDTNKGTYEKTTIGESKD